MIDLLDLGELDRSGDAKAGIGNSDIYMAGLAEHLLHRPVRTLLGADITFDMSDAFMVFAMPA